jgi:hypothetical protein
MSPETGGDPSPETKIDPYLEHMMSIQPDTEEDIKTVRINAEQYVEYKNLYLKYAKDIKIINIAK